MRLLIVSRSLFPIVGGSESYVHALAKYFSREDNSVCVITSDAQSKGYQYPYEIRRVVGLSELHFGEAKFHTLLPDLKKAIESFSPDVIYVQNVYLGLAVALIHESLPHAAVVAITDHNTPIPRLGKWLAGMADYEISLSIGSFVLRQGLFDLYIAPSAHFLKWALKMGVDPTKAIRIYPGFDLEKYSPGEPAADVRNRVRGPLNERTIIAPGRLIPRKGQASVIKAVELMRRDYPTSVRLLLTSSTESRSQQEYLRDLQARFEGAFQVDHFLPEEMPDVYRSADCVLFSTEGEGLGFVAIEAMASEVPLITCNVSGLDEFIDPGANCLTVVPGEIPQLAEQLKLILADEPLRSRLVACGRSTVETMFDQKEQWSRLERALSSAMKCKRRNVSELSFSP